MTKPRSSGSFENPFRSLLKTMRCFGLFLLLIVFSFPLFSQTEEDEEKVSFGTLFRGDTYAWLFPHKGGPLRLGITYYGRNGGGVVRFYRPDGNLARRVYTGVGGTHTERVDFGPNAPAGVYQIRSVHRDVKVQILSQPAMEFGIMPLRSGLHAERKGQFQKVFFRVPDSVSKLVYESRECQVRLSDQSERPVPVRNKTADLSGKNGQVLCANLAMRPVWPQYFRVYNFCPVFCPSPEMALQIGEIDFTGAGGKRYPFAFQVQASLRLAELEKKLSPIPNADFQSSVKAIEADPQGRFFFGKRGVLSVFQAQVRQTGGKGPFPEEPALPAAVYSLKKPYNPWYHSPVLKQYVLREGLKFLLKIDDGDCFSDGWSGRGAERIFSLAYAFSLVCADLEKQDRELWKEGLMRVADRYSMYQSWRESRSSLWPLILEMIFRGTGDPSYKVMGEDFIRVTCLPENGNDMQTGYQREILGCDPKNQGIGVLNTALYYRLTGSKDALRGLKTIFRFLNCSSCPGEQGKILTASNFASLESAGWNGRLFGRESGSLLRGFLPESDCWPWPPDPEDRLSVRELLKLRPEKGVRAVSPDSPWFVRVLCPPGKSRPGTFPALYPTPFIRDFNQEFSAVRTRSAYLFVYAGQNLKRRSWLEKEYRKNESKNRPSSAVNKRGGKKWDMVPGISLLSSDRWGPFLLSKSWNGYTQHMICCEKKKTFLYPDFWNNLSQVRDDGSVSIKTTTRPGKSLEIVRIISPQANGVKIQLKIRKNPTNALKIYEQIPWVKGKNYPSVQCESGGRWTGELCPARYFRFGRGVYLGFDRKVKPVFGPDTEKEGICLGCLRIPLEEFFTEKGELDFVYEIRFAR